MNTGKVSAGAVHKTPADMKKILLANSKMHALWEDITVLARNEWICWIENAAKLETRQRRLRIMKDKMSRGERRPCCWMGCPHRQKS